MSSVRPLGQFPLINQYRLAFPKAEPKGGSAQQTSPYYGEYTPNAYGDRLELRKPAAWDTLGLPKAEPKGGAVLTEPNGAGDMPDEPIGGGKVGKPHVVSMPSPNRNSRNGAKIDTIVLHHTAGGGTAEDVGRFFKNPGAEVSSHYVVGKDGTIVQPVADGDRAWHAGPSEFRGRSDVNDFSLGIEIVNRGDGKDPYTDKQYEALGKLVAYMMSEYGIPMDRITGHKDVAIPRGRKIDPSANFSYDRLKQEVNKHLNGASRPEPKPPAPKPEPETPPSNGGTYTVKQGDSLSKIAQRLLGDMNRWREIYDLNKDKIANPNTIYPGQTLRLPGKAEAPKPEPKPEPNPEPKPAPAPTPAPTATPAPTPAPQPAPAPQLSPEQVQAQITQLRQQLAAIEAELTAMIAALDAQPTA